MRHFMSELKNQNIYQNRYTCRPIYNCTTVGEIVRMTRRPFNPLEVVCRGSETQLQVGVYLINPYSASIDFSRQNVTSVDVRFWRLKSIPAL